MDAPTTCHADKEARVTLPLGFADHLVIIEQIDESEVRIKKAQAIPEGEAWLWRNPSALAVVQQGIEQARRGEFVPGPDLDADAARFGNDEEFAAEGE